MSPEHMNFQNKTPQIDDRSSDAPHVYTAHPPGFVRPVVPIPVGGRSVTQLKGQRFTLWLPGAARPAEMIDAAAGDLLKHLLARLQFIFPANQGLLRIFPATRNAAVGHPLCGLPA